MFITKTIEPIRRIKNKDKIILRKKWTLTIKLDIKHSATVKGIKNKRWIRFYVNLKNL